MALLLSIETSTHSFSCAVHQDRKLVTWERSTSDQTTASMLAVSIDKLFQESRTEKEALSAVVVAAGPGSYTGLRIGVATAKGISYALRIPLVSVETLKVMAYEMISRNNPRALFCPMLDARRMEVYCSTFDSNLNVVSPTEAKIIDESSFANQLDQQQVLFFGEGADKCKDMIKHPNAVFVSGIKPTAVALGELGYDRFAKGEFEDIEHFEPFYLKDFVIKKPNSVS